jgi:hypothetical protein
LAYENYQNQNTKHISGTISAGDGGFNQPWHWHLLPDTIRLVDISMEVCDGRPSYVEQGFIKGIYCPWASKVTKIGCSTVSTTTTTTTNPSTTPTTSQGGGCLKEGTKLLTPEGLKKIEDLNVGDSVIGYKSGKKVETKVLAKMTHSGSWTIYYYKGSWFTGNHRVYPSLNDEAVEVETLSSVSKQYTGKVYDIKTGTENYFGENDLLIHNKGGGKNYLMDLTNIIREFIEKISGFNK